MSLQKLVYFYSLEQDLERFRFQFPFDALVSRTVREGTVSPLFHSGRSFHTVLLAAFSRVRTEKGFATSKPFGALFVYQLNCTGEALDLLGIECRLGRHQKYS